MLRRQMDDEDVLGHLAEPPEGEPPEPPVDTAAQLLPFDGLIWENFERLCYRLALLEGAPEHTQLFGTRGQAQSGIDIYSRLPDRTYATYQCKREEDFGESDIEAAVKKFTDGEWAAQSSRFVLCTSASSLRTQLARKIEEQARRLKEREPPVVFEVWDAERPAADGRSHLRTDKRTDHADNETVQDRLVQKLNYAGARPGGASADGTRIFIQTPIHLTRADRDSTGPNGWDVYLRTDNVTSLISKPQHRSDASSAPVFVAFARGGTTAISAAGDRVFLQTRQRLTADDTDKRSDVFLVHLPRKARP